MTTEEDFIQTERNKFRNAYGAFVAIVIILLMAGFAGMALFGIVYAIMMIF
jgi:hypothetical protein